jgi:PIN domain nuclease of toxin-antitoxin system
MAYLFCLDSSWLIRLFTRMTNRDLVSALQKDESWISSVDFAHAKNDALRHGIFDHRILRRALRDVAPERLNVEELIQCMQHFDVVMPFAGRIGI